MSDGSSPPPILAARNVRLTYLIGHRELEVLRGVDLELREGSFVALQGASGAGKNTLLNLLGGLDSPTSGEIWFAGQNLSALPPADLARFRNRKVGFVFQAYHLLPELDALENVCLPGRVARRPAAECQRACQELLARVGLSHRLDHRPQELSGGEQQRVAIARALINDPLILLADEPTGNLDSHTGEEIIELLCALQKERQSALLIATHDSRVASRAPVIFDLVDGQIARNGEK